MNKAKYVDISGQKFNHLTAVRLDRHESGEGFYWIWKCDCGIEKPIRLCYVLSGHIRSCGCARVDPRVKQAPLCKICGEISTRKTAQGGYSLTCQRCYNKQKNHTNKPPVYMFNRARSRAKKLGIEFSLSVEDIIIPEFCPILGIKLGYSGMNGRDSSPSLDRKNARLGYIPGNVAVISHLANRIKNTGTAEQHRRIAEWMEEEAA